MYYMYYILQEFLIDYLIPELAFMFRFYLLSFWGLGYIFSFVLGPLHI